MVMTDNHATTFGFFIILACLCFVAAIWYHFGTEAGLVSLGFLFLALGFAYVAGKKSG